MRACALIVLAVLGFGAANPHIGFARPPLADSAPGGTPSRAASIVDNTARMDVNLLDMFVTNIGSLAYDRMTGNAGLIYPKGTTKSVVFAAGPWIGATVDGQIRMAIGEYGTEFVPGPMIGGTFVPDQDRFHCYRIDRGDVTSPDYLNWPVGDGAPLDAYGNPLLLGDATIWSVYNDADPATHTLPDGLTPPLGVEIRQTVFAFNGAGPLGATIYVKFQILNKGGNTLENAYFSMWADPDLGFYADDLAGSDPALDLGYAYNATNADGVYGAQPPAVGFRLIRGPIVSTAPGVYDTLGMTAFVRYTNGGDPVTPNEAYDLMHGLQRDGTPIVDPFLGITTFEVPGDPVSGIGWLDSSPSDRRFLVSSGPFRMAPGDVQEIVLAVVVGQGDDRLASVQDLKAKAEIAGTVPEPTEPIVHAADVDLDPDTINLESRAPWVTAYIESREFDVTSIDVSSVRLAGWVAPEEKGVALGDHDDDLIPDLRVRFRRAWVDPILTIGPNHLEVTGSLVDGSRFRGADDVRVVDVPALRAASVVPNPLNPSGSLRFDTAKPGPVRVRIFDLQGRLVRTLADELLLPSGAHEIRIDVRGGRGAELGSGIYLFRVETPEGERRGRFIVLK